MQQPLLKVSDLNVGFETNRGLLRPVRDVSFSIFPGQTVALVGESGCGKSVTSLSILRLIPEPPGKVLGGQILFEGRDLLKLPERDMRAVRGKDIAMIFQEPMTSLNPVFTIGEQIAEAVRLHEGLGRRAAMDKTVDMLKLVHIPNPERRVKEYPHQLSGGMRQRVMIAMALSCNPKLLIADEPTTALDVTTQAQILELMRRLRTSHGSAIILITHDMGVISEIADRVLVMYGGRAVERGSKTDVFRRPRHPYTWGLLDSVPRVTGPRVRRLAAIPGSPVRPWDLPTGCVFAPRCALRHEACEARPELRGVDGHLDACWLPDNRAELRQQARVSQP